MSETVANPDAFTRNVATLLLGIARKSIRAGGTQVEGLRPPQGVFLIELADRGPVTMSEMAKDAKIHPTVVTRFLDRLVRKGFVERQRDESDRRVVRVDLTAKGRETADMLLRSFIDRVETALKDAGKKDRDILLAMLARIDEALSE